MSFTNGLKEKIKEKKKILIGVCIALIIVIGVGYKAIMPPSPETVFGQVKDNKEVKNLNSYLEDIYPSDGGFLGLFKEQNKDNKAKVLSLMIDKLNNEFKSKYGMSLADYEAVKISKVDIKKRNYDSDYVDINVTVNNSGKTSISYVKINLYYKDINDNIIRSEWTNDNSVIKAGASQVITKMTKSDGWEKVSAEIEEIKK